MLSLSLIPALAQYLILPFCPESPRYLLLNKAEESEAEAGGSEPGLSWHHISFCIGGGLPRSRKLLQDTVVTLSAAEAEGQHRNGVGGAGSVEGGGGPRSDQDQPPPFLQEVSLQTANHHCPGHLPGQPAVWIQRRQSTLKSSGFVFLPQILN